MLPSCDHLAVGLSAAAGDKPFKASSQREGCRKNPGFSRYQVCVVPVLSCPASILHRVDKATSPHDVCGVGVQAKSRMRNVSPA